MKLKIGNVTLENNLILAPMAGVTDLPFRLLCKEQGAGLICTEMVSAKAIHFKNKNTESLMEIDERERPVSLQLFGSEPDLMADIAKQIEYRNFDILDINMGCPVPKVVNNGEGSALMKNPKLVHEIVYKVSRETGCDGIMLGRAVQGNPWLFSEILYYQETGKMKPKPSMEEIKKMMLRHAKLQLEYKGVYTGMREMRKHVAWYTSGMPHSASVRRMVNEVESYEQLEELVNRL